jgi:hypothetical protein
VRPIDMGITGDDWGYVHAVTLGDYPGVSAGQLDDEKYLADFNLKRGHSDRQASHSALGEFS